MLKKMKQMLIPYYTAFLETRHLLSLQKQTEFEASRLEQKIIRQLHGVEKGLCLENPRVGFGIPKIREMFEYIDCYVALSLEDNFCLRMARDAIQAYLEFHEKRNYTSADLEWIRGKYEELTARLKTDEEIFGGIRSLQRGEMMYSVEEIEKLFFTRHSIREFSGDPVSEEDVKRAIQLAQTCPSACNRQCARVYSVKPQKYMGDTNVDLQGIGGFADDADRFLLITGKQTSYTNDERHQYIVSASIFAGYLSLALQTYGIASCVVQRSIFPTEDWCSFKKLNGIPDDEQIVLMIAIGRFKEETKVPVSKRFELDKIYRILD